MPQSASPDRCLVDSAERSTTAEPRTHRSNREVHESLVTCLAVVRVPRNCVPALFGHASCLIDYNAKNMCTWIHDR